MVDAMDVVQTKTRLIEEAERLIAENGVRGVSLRKINIAAGQRNASAIHYHFGTKLALINAVFNLRLPVAAEMRGLLLDEADAAPDEDKPRMLIRAIMMPFADCLVNPEKSENFVGFMMQVRSDPRLDWGGLQMPEYSASMVRVEAFVSKILPEQSSADLRRRLAIIHSMTMNGIADISVFRQRRLLRGEETDVALAVENLVSLACGALMAPFEPSLCHP